MEIVINSENKESIYEVVYDEEKIKELISEIIKNCSIRKQTIGYVKARNITEAINIANSKADLNGNKKYENISDLKEEPINDPYDYWRHGDPRVYSFTANKLFTPELVIFLTDLLNGKSIDFEWFFKRKELTKRHEIQQKIETIDSQIDEISNFETERKIKKLKELEKMIAFLDTIPEFDYNLLSKYYDIVEKYIKLELIQETIRYPRKRKA